VNFSKCKSISYDYSFFSKYNYMLKKIQVYGERCSGTTYLQELLVTNFNVELFSTHISNKSIWGHKHFFGFNDLSNSDDILFIGIVRKLCDWVNSFYRNPYHLPNSVKKDPRSFLNNEFYSVDEKNKEYMDDRNMETGKRYKNIFHMRHVKNKFLVEKMPTLVKNYILITYEDLTNHFESTMNRLKNCNLEVKSNIKFPLNISYYKNEKNRNYKKNNEKKIPDVEILKRANLFYEIIIYNKNLLKKK